MRQSSIILLSGGLDSLASFHWALQNTDPLMAVTYDYGQRAAQQEIKVSKQLCEIHDIPHKVVPIEIFKTFDSGALIQQREEVPHPSSDQLDNKEITQQTAKAVWVPNRNGVFINIAASYAEASSANTLIVGFNVEEAATFPDNSEGFVKAANQFLSYSTLSQVSLTAPMAHLTKLGIVEWLLKEEISLDHLWSCYYGQSRMCGACESCQRCRRALFQAGAEKWLEKLF